MADPFQSRTPHGEACVALVDEVVRGLQCGWADGLSEFGSVIHVVNSRAASVREYDGLTVDVAKPVLKGLIHHGNLRRRPRRALSGRRGR